MKTITSFLFLFFLFNIYAQAQVKSLSWSIKKKTWTQKDESNFEGSFKKAYSSFSWTFGEIPVPARCAELYNFWKKNRFHFEDKATFVGVFPNLKFRVKAHFLSVFRNHKAEIFDKIFRRWDRRIYPL